MPRAHPSPRRLLGSESSEHVIILNLLAVFLQVLGWILFVLDFSVLLNKQRQHHECGEKENT